jgi:hypothetical protein
MIRPATFGDLWALRRKPRSFVMLYNEALLAGIHRWQLTALRLMLHGSTRDGATLVLRERGARAVLQTLRRDQRPEHDIVMLAAYEGGNGSPTDADAWFRLLEAHALYAGQVGIQRVYAALSQRHDELREVFRQIGFFGYCTQTVLRLQGPDWDQGTTLAPMRAQYRSDIWAIHKLYGAITPRPVQQAEARDSRTWARWSVRGWKRSRVRSWVLGPADNLTAYMSVSSGSTAHVLALLVRPEYRDITTDILRFGLGQINDDLPVYLLLRDYQRELMLPAEDLGFQAIGEQALLCKHLTQPVRRSVLLPALEPGLEPPTPIPTISRIGDDARFYVRTHRYHEQYRSAVERPANGDSRVD